jgi:hypothetical protein
VKFIGPVCAAGRLIGIGALKGSALDSAELFSPALHPDMVNVRATTVATEIDLCNKSP